MAGVVVFHSQGHVGVHENHDQWDLEVLTAAAHWALQLMGKCMRSWSDLLVHRRRTRLRGRYCMEMIPSAHRRALQCWKLATMGQVHSRLVADRQKFRVLRSWQWAGRQSCSVRILVRKNGLLQCQKVLHLWKRATARLLRCRRILAIQRCRTMVKTCGKALSAWRLQAAALAARRCWEDSRCRMHQEAALNAWRQLCSQRLWGRMRLEMRREHALMLWLFGEWKWQVAAELALRRWVWRARSQAEEDERHREANETHGESLAFQNWKWWTLHQKEVLQDSETQIQLLHISFACWSRNLKVSKFRLRLEVKQTTCLLRATWHAWRQHRLSMQTALRCSIHKNLLKLVAEAFEMWQIASVSGLALPDPLGETSLDLLEVSASTQHAQSGKDTEAPDDVNRTLSDLSGLTFTEGSPILPLAFESSPEDVLKGYSQWIPNSASSAKEIQEIVGERLQELRKVPQAFQESATCTSPPISSPQGSQGPQATAFRVPVAPVAFLASPLRSRQPSPVHTPQGSGSQWSEASVPAVPSLVKRQKQWQSDIFRAWLGRARLKTKTLAIEECLKSRATCRHHLAWHQFWVVQIHHRKALCKRCLMQWYLVQQMYVSRIQSLTQKTLLNELSLWWRRWQDRQLLSATLADCQYHRSLQSFSKRLLAEWQRRGRLRKRCQSMGLKQQKKLLVHACRVWKSRCEQRRRGLAIFHGRMLHLAAKTWMAWCDYRSFMLSKLTSAERMAVALQRCVGSTLGRRAALQRWALHSRQPGLGPPAPEIFVQKRMRKVQLLAHLAHCVARWRQQLLHRVMRSWWKVPLRRLLLERLNAKSMQDLLITLETWRVAVQRIKSFRQKVMRHALHRWHSWRGLQRAGRKVCHSGTQSLALRCWHYLRLARRHGSLRRREQKANAMVAWRAAVKTTGQQRLLMRVFLREWRNMLGKVQQLRSRQVLCAWHGIAISRGYQRRLFQQWRRGILELRWRRLSKSFSRWCSYHSAFLNAAEMASISRTALLKESWSFWTQAVSRWRAKQRVEAKCRSRRVHKMLAAWTSLHRATLLGHHAVARHVPSWALWRLGVTISRVQKIDQQKTMHLWRAGLVAVQLQRQNHFFRAWHVFLRSQCRCTALKRSVLAMWMTLVDESRLCRNRQCLAGWRAMTKAAAIDRHCLVHVWSRWQLLLEDQRAAQHRQQGCRAFLAWHGVLLRSRLQLQYLSWACKAWRHGVAVQKAKRRKKTKEWLFLWRFGIQNLKVLDFAWVQWQLLCAASARRRARVILRLWCNESHRQHQGKALLGAWRVVVSLSRLPYLFHAWRAVLLSRRLSRSSVSFVLGWWLSSARQAKSLKRFAFRALLMVHQNRRHRFLYSVFTSWRAYQSSSRRDQRLELLVLKSWASVHDARIQQTKAMCRFADCCERSMVIAAEASARSAAKVFHAWRCFCQRCLVRRRCATTALQVAQQQPLRKAFDCFQSCVHEQRLYRQRFGPLAQHLASFCKRRLSSTWSRWRQHTKCSHLHRTGRLRMMTRTLKVWRERNVHRKSLKAAVKGIAARRNHRLSSSYLQNWYSAARKCRLSDWMLRWRCAVASSQTQQADLAKAFFRKRLLQRAFGHWEMSLHCGQLRKWSLKVPRFSSRFRTRDFSELTMLAALRVAEQ